MLVDFCLLGPMRTLTWSLGQDTVWASTFWGALQCLASCLRHSAWIGPELLCHPSSVTCRPCSAVCPLSSVVRGPSSSIRHPSSVICHPSSVICHLSFTGSSNWLEVIIFCHARGVPTDLLDVKISRLPDSDSFHRSVEEMMIFLLKVLIFCHSRGVPSEWKCWFFVTHGG